MFYKITEKGIEKAPKMLNIDGKQVFTNSEKIYNENGYYKVQDMPCSLVGNYKPVYYLKDNIIIKDWQKVEVVPLSYKDRIINRIRAVYSVDDEIAILRQRDTKPDEYTAYNDFVEQIKAEERAKGDTI